ncbi:hypothetical protein TTHERM_000396969 (macronuclear) [Tetrahymena thermophila SB210]|uniref:Uncharacterized protein n=1 Tax=Tetrahymena thermophila (strain SB210) TaxID=312017 RepID=W7XD88_TETTS|nr:hypothetical protein TTHERM_000396969 [Tetrahymena thermophila SB210]EWS75472.1 hypothetical protein TTHERM_000396969 [Tetrahymena thermophila SB210]|eukprot:XP_012651941.1 hypothetical protein TTHERM_000396969 [Tetrahymena thermophila SB210]
MNQQNIIFYYFNNFINYCLSKSYNKLGDQGITNLGSILAKTSISSLVIGLSDNNINQFGAFNFSMLLAKCTNLSTLNLGFYKNNLLKNPAAKLVSNFSPCTNLQDLKIILWQLVNFFTQIQNQQVNKQVQKIKQYTITNKQLIFKLLVIDLTVYFYTQNYIKQQR